MLRPTASGHRWGCGERRAECRDPRRPGALVGVIGDDAAGAELARLVEQPTASTCQLVVAPGRPTTAKTRFMAGSHQLLRLDEETTEPLSDEIDRGPC